MTTPNDQPPDDHPLVAQLEELDRILLAFTAPVIDEHAGLRLMGEHLRDRRDDLHTKLAEAETPTLEIAVEGAVQVDGTLPVGFVAALLRAVAAAVEGHLPADAAEASDGAREVLLRWAGGPDDGTGVRLCGPSAPGARAATGITGRSEAFTAAVASVLDGLEAAGGNPGDSAANDLVHLTLEHWVRLRLRWSAPGHDSREVVLDPQQLS